MKMFEQIGEFKADSLIASPDFPILTEGIGLKSGQGVLKRGALIVVGADKAGCIAGGAAAGEGARIFGILTDDVDTGEAASDANVPAVAYQTGAFNRAAVLLSGDDTDVSVYEKEMRDAGIYLRSVQEYERG